MGDNVDLAGGLTDVGGGGEDAAALSAGDDVIAPVGGVGGPRMILGNNAEGEADPGPASPIGLDALL